MKTPKSYDDDYDGIGSSTYRMSMILLRCPICLR